MYCVVYVVSYCYCSHMHTATSLRVAVRLVKATASALLVVGMALAWLAPEDAPYLETHPRPEHTAPVWDAAHRTDYPQCMAAEHPAIGVTTTTRWIPRAMVVQSRDGAVDRMIPYTPRNVHVIDRTWNNQSPTDDLFVIGVCK